MGKKKVIEASTTEETQAKPEASSKSSSKKRFESGILNIESTYNNTKVVLTDMKGNTLAWSTSGAIGFRGAKKGTPFAAAKIGETIGEKAEQFGIKEVKVVVKGVGSGRESAIRGFISKGINLLTIQDATPVPHNGPKPPKPRRA
ncbi:30S ribosomal protein S11 [Candidatus Parcubacteria bacterium]|nr:30S ribosomal protein S11 [Candidatus Parcubacteria bacterium]